MEPGVIAELTGVVAVLVGGAIVLTPLLALSARFALKPLIESWARIRQAQGPEAAQLQDRRISLLEAELQHLQEQVRHLSEAEDFRRQLSAPASDAAPPAVPPGGAL